MKYVTKPSTQALCLTGALCLFGPAGYLSCAAALAVLVALREFGV